MGRPALTDLELSIARERTCDIALALFDQGGRDAVTLRAIAKVLGCSPMQPYRYFPGGKSEILATVKTRAFLHFAAHQDALLGENIDNDIDLLENYGAGYVRYARENPASFRIMFELELLPEETFPDLAEAARRARTPVMTAIRRLVDDGVLQGEPAQIAKILWASVHGLATLHLTGQLEGDSELEDLLPFLTRTLRAGILSFTHPAE
jgi:AcrR family transcriptional regulator